MNESDSKTERDSGAVARRRPMYYGGNARPMYYGSSGGVPYGSADGGVYGGFAGGSGQEDESVVGAITFTRLTRVCLQRWVTIVVFLIIGLIAAFAALKLSPTIYEAVSIFEMRVLPTRNAPGEGLYTEGDRGGNMEEVFNTRVALLRSRMFFQQVIERYRSDFPSATWETQDLIKMLKDSKQTLQRRSKLVLVSTQTGDPQLAADLANVYMDSAAHLMVEQNKKEATSAITLLVAQAEQAQRDRERVDKTLLDFRMANQIDLMTSQLTMQQQSLEKINLDILSLEGQAAAAALVFRTLETIKDDPEKFGSLPESIPRASEIAMTFVALQKATMDKDALLIRVTAQHPDVKLIEKEIEIRSEQFADTVFRSQETSKANLDLLQRRLDQLRPKYDDILKSTYDIELKIVSAKSTLDRLTRERNELDTVYQDFQKRIRDVGYTIDESAAMILPIESAIPPEYPVWPKPLIIFPAGLFVGLLLGVLFVLICDHFEDKIDSISDIEQRVRLKTLAVFPHVQRKKREQIARLVSEDKFSQFAEAVATLRNLLDSPRYADMSKVLLCVSTQPGEGKTITSCSLAISCALSGQKTLLIDFDMRRPRIARIFSKAPSNFISLPHTLAKADTDLFTSLPTPSDIANLDLVCSRPSSEISPASLMGSGTIIEFFKWARENYDRIIVDSPPFGVVGDVMTLSSLVDAVMVMCCPQRTRFNPLRHAARQLTEAGAQVIGVVVNDVNFSRHNFFDKENYHYKYAYQYASKYGYSTARNPSKRSLKPATAIGSADTKALINEEELSSSHEQETGLDVKDVFDASMVDDDE